MTTINFCRKMDVETRIALDRYAKHLGAEEMTIHKDGTITLMCKDGCICDNYLPTSKELYNR